MESNGLIADGSELNQLLHVHRFVIKIFYWHRSCHFRNQCFRRSLRFCRLKMVTLFGNEQEERKNNGTRLFALESGVTISLTMRISVVVALSTIHKPCQIMDDVDADRHALRQKDLYSSWFWFELKDERDRVNQRRLCAIDLVMWTELNRNVIPKSHKSVSSSAEATRLKGVDVRESRCSRTELSQAAHMHAQIERLPLMFDICLDFMESSP